MCLDSPLVLHQSDGEGIQYCTRLLLRPEPCVSWTKSFASEATDAQGQSVPAKPIKKGLSAGTVPPATEQVPHGVLEQQQAQAQGTGKTLRNTGSTNGLQQHSAAVGKDRPSASSVPAGADQVPPSSVGHIPSQVVQTGSSNDDEPSTSDSQHPESMDSLITDIEDAGQLGKAPSKPSAVHSAQPVVSRWQRFQWWIWGTPQQYWTDQISTDNASSTAQSSKDGPDAASTSNTDSPEGSKMWQRSRYSLGDIIGSAILRSGITKDEDVARSALSTLCTALSVTALEIRVKHLRLQSCECRCCTCKCARAKKLCLLTSDVIHGCRFVSKSAAIAAYTLAGFSLLGTLGVDTKPLVAGLGVGGFTAGFALRASTVALCIMTSSQRLSLHNQWYMYMYKLTCEIPLQITACIETIQCHFSCSNTLILSCAKLPGHLLIAQHCSCQPVISSKYVFNEMPQSASVMLYAGCRH